jgi:hypothetical protein
VTASRRLTALVCALCVLAVAAVATPALGAGNPILTECKTGKLSHPYTVSQLRHALNVMPADLKQYSSCFDVVQQALVTARRNHGTLPAPKNQGSGGSFLPTPVIIILVILILAAVTFGALAVRRRRAGGDSAGGDSAP